MLRTVNHGHEAQPLQYETPRMKVEPGHMCSNLCVSCFVYHARLPRNHNEPDNKEYC